MTTEHIEGPTYIAAVDMLMGQMFHIAADGKAYLALPECKPHMWTVPHDVKAGERFTLPPVPSLL